MYIIYTHRSHGYNANTSAEAHRPFTSILWISIKYMQTYYIYNISMCACFIKEITTVYTVV